MYAQTTDDIVDGIATGDGALGIPIPRELSTLPPQRLRVVGGNVIDAATLSTFHIDQAGRKHAAPGDGWQPLSCVWDDDLVRNGDVWRARTRSETMAPGIKSECQRRICAVASDKAQMNMTAAAAAGRFSKKETTTYSAALDWVDAMRSACRALIAAADADYADDSKWPALPSGVADLCAKY